MLNFRQRSSNNPGKDEDQYSQMYVSLSAGHIHYVAEQPANIEEHKHDQYRQWMTA